jgi:hypothetical protein
MIDHYSIYKNIRKAATSDPDFPDFKMTATARSSIVITAEKP